MTAPQTILPIPHLMTTAWHKVRGVKRTFFAAFVLFLIISVLANGVVDLFAHAATPIPLIISCLAKLFTTILQAGLLYLGIRCAYDETVSYDMLFHPLNKRVALKIIGSYIIEYAINAPFILAIMFIKGGFLIETANLIICGIAIYYIAMRTMLVQGYVLVQNYGPWQAVKSSFRATRGHVIAVSLIGLVQLFIVLISFIPLGIGLIWTFPMMCITYGLVYKTLQHQGLDA